MFFLSDVCLKHLLGTATHQKCPITPTILLKIQCHLDTNLPFYSIIWGLLCTAFFSFLCKSNLTVTPTTSFDLGHHVTHQGVEFTVSRAFLRIRWKKTLQDKEGVLLVLLSSILGSMLFPSSAVLNFFTLIPASSAALCCAFQPRLAAILSPSPP